jgi:hypothetical protein
MELTKSFSAAQYHEALESWAWIGLEAKSPVCASLFGNVFLVSDEGCWYLDIVEGAISRAWPDLDEMRSSLASAEARDRYLLEGLVHAATDRGLTLGEASIYDFTVAPVLGGSLAIENVSVTDFVVGARKG